MKVNGRSQFTIQKATILFNMKKQELKKPKKI